MRPSPYQYTDTTKISLFVEKSYSKDTSTNDTSKKNCEIIIFNLIFG